MPTSILAVGTSATTSTDQVVLTDKFAMVFLTPTTGNEGIADGGGIEIQLKTAAGTYVTQYRLTSRQPNAQIPGPCTFRVKRSNAGAGLGVELAS